MSAKVWDAIVVGSGISGGWAAKELTERGLEVLVLEAGPPTDPAKDYVEHLQAWQLPFRGYGEAQNERNSPAYTEIAAIPSATVTVASGGETLAAVRWEKLQQQGAIETPRARLEMLDRGRNWVRVTVLDDETARLWDAPVHTAALRWGM